MSESRVPPPPLPRPFVRVITEEPVSRQDLENVKKSMQQQIDNLNSELKREKDLTKKLAKSGEVLQEILAAPDFKALSVTTRAVAEVAVTQVKATQIDEPPIEYVEVTEIDLTDSEVKNQEVSEKK